MRQNVTESYAKVRQHFKGHKWVVYSAGLKYSIFVCLLFRNVKTEQLTVKQNSVTLQQ